MDKKRIIEILDEMGTLLELTGENPFRSRAYHNAAQVIGGFPGDLEQLAREESLTSIKGIGQGLADTITELLQTGKSKMHEELRTKVPSGILEILRVQGLGPKKVKVLYEKLQIRSLAELREACEQQRLRSLEGFGARTEENILKNIIHLERSSDKHLYPQAFESAEKIITQLKQIKGIKRCDYAGSLQAKERNHRRYRYSGKCSK